MQKANEKHPPVHPLALLFLSYCNLILLYIKTPRVAIQEQKVMLVCHHRKKFSVLELRFILFYIELNILFQLIFNFKAFNLQ